MGICRDAASGREKPYISGDTIRGWILNQTLFLDLEYIKASILYELEGVEAIYLFGSVAQGNFGASSDYDIAVVVKRNPDAYIQKISDIRYALWERSGDRSISLFWIRRIWRLLYRLSMKLCSITGLFLAGIS